jgi:phage terminase large subunit GpA-like protein
MLSQLDYRQECRKLEVELRRAAGDEIHPDIREIVRGELDALRPTELISTHEVAVKYRYLPAFGGGKFRFQAEKTPYVEGIHDAIDDPSKRIVLVQGNARGVKTTAAENALLKIAKFGPARGVLWYMHSEPDLRRYVEERVDFFFREHDLEHKVSGRGGRSKWNLKMVDGMPWEWLPANPSTTRARSAAFIVADEIDAMRPAIGNAILTLIRNRQREYGSLAKAYIASHPDRGPSAGIAKLLEDSDRRLRFWTCPDCAHLMSPCVEAGRDRRVTWNVPELMGQVGEDMDRDALLDFVEANVFLVCPHCKTKITNEQRLELDRETGQWIGKGQTIDAHENVAGELMRHDTAGFIIHAFMTPFVTLGGLAREWAAAVMNFRDTGDGDLLKEVNVKSLGEVHIDPDDPASKVRDWKETKAAHLDTGYKLLSVPRGVDFLTMMVDVQGNRFEAGVWGWSRHRECWLIDRFSLKQREGLQEIAPGERLQDWDVLEKALGQAYPLNDGSGRYLGIAKMAVDTGGVPGVTNNARIWAANMLASGKCPQWRLMLSKGDRHLLGDLYGKPNRIKEDDGGRPLPMTVIERIVNVSAVKRVMARRLEISEPGPGFIHLPGDVEDRYVRELVSETYVNGEWIARGRNETWDTLIMCEVARALLAPENRAIDWAGDPPSFAVPFIPSQKTRDDANKSRNVDFFDRLARLNRGETER